MVFVIRVSIFAIIHLIKFDQSRLLGVPDSILPIASAMGYPKVVIKSSNCINRFELSFIFHDYNFITADKQLTIHHYFIACPTYQVARQTLFYSLQTLLGIDTANHVNLLNTILEGHNIHPRHFAELLSHASDFLSDTGRFR